MTSPQSNLNFSGGQGPSGMDLAELAAGYASGSLPMAEMEAFERRLIAGDADAVREFEAVQAVGAALLRANAASVTPPAFDFGALAGRAETGSSSHGSSGGWVKWSGWLAAAAAIVLAAIAWLPKAPPSPIDRPSTFEDVALMSDSKKADWTYWPPKAEGDAPEPGAGEVIAGADAVKGAVVWSGARQDGWVRLSNLPKNDPSQKQYQLWIIDKAQKYPIDGGTFDVPANSTGEIAVQLKPSIKVSQPVAIALTLEQPGGVVVPDQKRRVVVAMLP